MMAQRQPNQGRVYSATVGDVAPGRAERLLDFFDRRWRHSSRSEWAEHIAAGRITVDGNHVHDTELMLAAGQIVNYHRQPWVEPLPLPPQNLAVLYEDADVVAFFKPAGLPVMPSEMYYEHTAMAVLRRMYRGTKSHDSRKRNTRTGSATSQSEEPDLVEEQTSIPSPAHRLGAWTTGVLLCARSDQARRSLPAQFQRRTVTKEYRALAVGTAMADEFSVRDPIGLIPHPGMPGGVWAVCKGGKSAVSHCRVIQRRQTSTLLAVQIETGRPHQIRIHLAAAGCPLVGDPFYGSGGLPLQSVVAAAEAANRPAVTAAECIVSAAMAGKKQRTEGPSSCPPRTGHDSCEGGSDRKSFDGNDGGYGVRLTDGGYHLHSAEIRYECCMAPIHQRIH